jgi:hypothetical protein
LILGEGKGLEVDQMVSKDGVPFSRGTSGSNLSSSSRESGANRASGVVNALATVAHEVPPPFGFLQVVEPTAISLSRHIPVPQCR